MSTAPKLIDENVWLGANVVVLKGAVIGDNATIVANGVIARDVSAGTVNGLVQIQPADSMTAP